ncbi:bifunctional 2-polyprenyl-6-hydroxyphenol methylase/3-demethylubiquinol 3-O-methyltransferase UbiG [Methylocapsa acidiphila]|uniref:bifunctional 2-polyprenyl-6-hydroxyphenol methylase/3-demethylubiquinol 3-O-methyltransferase UbiG n=1 Tax=Methylocapsa acidiphila TaxID=133552 RepID=UPI00042A0082|nr:bifunctional 2-polyprenyl-6-hydroxyphenol methylase/3-demethylubiquinol 3-O-methyltransferase UbiG [Methylocapsa acidiphila]
MDSQEKLRRDATIDPEDVGRFEKLGADWWNPNGAMWALHKFNPVRVGYLRDALCRHFPVDGKLRGRHEAHALTGLSILDVGCGGGILSESLAQLGAQMTSIDPGRANIEAARTHAAQAELSIDYRCMSVEDLVVEGGAFDVVLTMEVIEHVADVGAFLGYAAALVRPGGMLVAATLNRTLKSFALAIVGAEYLLNWVPRGTHNWNQFVTPDELARTLRRNGLHIVDETGVAYDPLSGKWRLSRDMDVNYLIAAERRIRSD